MTLHRSGPLDLSTGVLSITKPGPPAKTPITGIAASDGAVTIALADPFAALPAYLAHFSGQILGPAAYDAEGAGTKVIGTGPYRVTDLAPPLSLRAESFPTMPRPGTGARCAGRMTRSSG